MSPWLLLISLTLSGLPFSGSHHSTSLNRPPVNIANVNETLPSFNAVTFDGRQVNNQSLKGKIVVMNFWFIACKPCIMEMPELNALVDEFKNNSSVVFLAPANNKATELVPFLKKQPFHYNIIPNARTLANESFKVSGYPTNLVADKQGNIVYKSVGYSTINKGEEGTVDALRKKIKELVKG